MNTEEFKNLIKIERLGKRSDADEYCLRADLRCVLLGGKVGAVASLIIGATITPFREEHVADAYKHEIAESINFMVKLFEAMKQDKYWRVKHTTTKLFDENGDKIGEDCKESKLVSRKVVTTEEITYYLDSKLDIKPVVRKNEN